MCKRVWFLVSSCFGQQETRVFEQYLHVEVLDWDLPQEGLVAGMIFDSPNGYSKVHAQDGELRSSAPQGFFLVAWAWETGGRVWVMVVMVRERRANLEIASNRTVFIPVTRTSTGPHNCT